MRGILRSLVACAAVTVVAGCSDSATNPTNPTNQLKTAADRPSLDYRGNGLFGGYRTTTITLTADGGSYDIGGLYTLSVPENGVCVLSSTYGPGTWDSPCTTLASGESIQVTATYGFARGGPVVDFSPGMRFAPDKQVTLSTDIYSSILTPFHDYFAANPESLRHFGMYYTPDLGATGTTDAASDPSLVTHINLATGVVWRRVKHFSGYNIASGMPCEPSPNNPDCVEGAGPAVEK